MLRAKISYHILCFGVVLFTFSCKKEKAPAQTINNGGISPNGSIQLNLTHFIDADSLKFGTQAYVNTNGDTFVVNVLDYYISNIKLIRTNNTVYTEAESYRLVKSSDPTTFVFQIDNVPAGDYKAVEFVIGVDSARNVSGAQTGALDPVHNMFWSWSSGYIMAKLEGTSPQAPGGSILYHISGFHGANNTLQDVHLDFTNNASVTASDMPLVEISANIAEWFRTPSLIKFNTMYMVASTGPDAVVIAGNYADMFTVDTVKN